MVRRVILIVAVLLSAGVFLAGCSYETKQHLREVSEYGRVFFMDDDGMGTVGNIK